ncbi:MAG: tripartite tricarboxylate transporter substrate binding protein [Betaproteobacteria bacterium]|nr:tripartite tricarboxylate transporter substrate binding protein [Betaproteobacteria bacterium]
MRTAYKAFGLLVALTLIFAGGESTAQSYPGKPIKFIVGFPPGGAPDTLGRMFGQKLAERLGQPVAVENKTGANGIIATEFVKNGEHDGYTLLVGATGPMVFNPGLYDRLPYDPVKDFIPLGLFETHPLVFAVHPSIAAASLKDLIAFAKANPGKLFYSSGAAPFQVAAELFKKQAGINIVHVPFKGSIPSLTAAVAGEVGMVAVEAPTAMAQLRAGKVRALAVTSIKRFPLLPNVPTVAESGFADFELILWIGLFAPSGTPGPIVDKLHTELAAILAQDSIKERLVAMGYDTAAGNMKPAEIGAQHKADVEKWTKVSRDLNIRAN